MNEMDAKERNWVSFVFAFELQSAAGNRLTRKKWEGATLADPHSLKNMKTPTHKQEVKGCRGNKPGEQIAAIE